MKSLSPSFVEAIRKLLISLAILFGSDGFELHAQTVNYLGLSINSELINGAFISDLSIQYCAEPKSQVRAGLGCHFAQFTVSQNERYRAIGPYAKLGFGYQILKTGSAKYPILINTGIDAATGILDHSNDYFFPGTIYSDYERSYRAWRPSSNLQVFISAMFIFDQKYFVELSPVFSPSVYLLNSDAELFPYRSSAGFGISSNPFNMNLRFGRAFTGKTT